METGKRYVGSSVDIYNRIHEHLHNLRNNKSHNQHWQNSWNKYGEDAFMFCVLEYCDESIRFDREQYYINSLNPEYNLTLNVVANFGHEISIETKQKISNTLKEKYASGEIETYKQQHNWETIYIYNVKNKTLVGEFPYLRAALRFLDDVGHNYIEGKLYKDTYCLSKIKFNTINELCNYINEIVLTARSSFGKYIICESESGKLTYFRNLAECAKFCKSSRSTLNKHHDASISNPFIIKKSNYKFYYSDKYIPVVYEQTAVPLEESSELLSGNIGKSPETENPEINSKITKGFESSYSAESE
jgi:group I intron endonuclease